MFELSPKSFQGFKAEKRDRNRAELRRYLRQRFPQVEPLAADETANEVIAAAEQLVDRFDLPEEGIPTICDLLVMYGPEFWKEEWADVLLMDGITGREKYTILRRRCEKQLNLS
jgi:hypothetical protein